MTAYNIVKAECECGNIVDVVITDHLKTTAKPSDIQIYSALLGTKKCSKCGKEVWVRGYIEIHTPEIKA